MPEAQKILENVFGYGEFIGRQREVIDHVSAGGDGLVLMPTGGGKSLCYQIPAMLRPGVGVVVSPLIALMRDQVQGLTQNGVRAACLNSSMPPQEGQEVMRRLNQGSLDLLYVAPERLCRPQFLDFLSRLRIALFAIDEAHCVSQWGHDFRPEYLQLSVLAERFGHVPRLALTATADDRTRRDIVTQLRLDRARVFATGFDRPNIRYTVIPKERARRTLLAMIREKHMGEAGIVYRASRKKVERTAEFLNKHGIRALPYHAGLPATERSRNQEIFMNEEGVVMAATIAFGMGVDKPNVRFVAHLDLPKSLEAYHQETGRAGRDGLPAEAFMTYGLQDVGFMRVLIEQGEADEARKRIERYKLERLLDFCETPGCRRQALLGYFGEHLSEPCGNCDTCQNPPETFEGTVIAKKALSNIFRTEQRFGANHLTDVLTGKLTTRVMNFGHDQVSTWNIGTELDADGWKSVYRQLAASGRLSVDPDRYNALVLNERSWAVMRGEEEVRFRRDPVQPKKTRKRAKSRKVQDEGVLATSEAVRLWERLREQRLELSKQQAVPPYAVLADRTLLEMVRFRPRDRDEMACMSGMGKAKMSRYADVFLGILTGWEEQEGRPATVEDIPEDRLDKQRAKAERDNEREGEPKTLSATQRQSMDMLRELGSAQDVARERGIRENTVFAHLAECIAHGELDAAMATGFDKATVRCIEETIQCFQDEGYDALTPVWEALNKAIGFEELRCIRAGLARE